MSDETRQRDQAKQERLAAALRENLKRRKAQAKARAVDRRSSSEHSAETDPQSLSDDS